MSDNEHFADLWLVFSPLHPDALLMQIKKENPTAQNCQVLFLVVIISILFQLLMVIDGCSFRKYYDCFEQIAIDHDIHGSVHQLCQTARNT